MSSLSARQQALLDALRAAEPDGLALDLDALATATGYSVSSIKTYFTKKLDGVLVFRADDGTWRARGALRCTPQAFARHMSQKAGASSEALSDEASWRRVLRKLLYEGRRRRYTLSDDEELLIAALRHTEPEAPQQAVQPRLFDAPAPRAGPIRVRWDRED